MIGKSILINKINGVTVYIEDIANINWAKVITNETFKYKEAHK